MSSLRVALGETVRSIWIPAMVAVSELVSGNEKPIGALFEQEKPAHEIYPKVVHDELLEPAWETFFSSILARIAKIVTPKVPEQLVIVPSKLFGAGWHWLITHEQSINKQKSSGQNKSGDKKNIFGDFFETFIKKPTDLFLKLCGIEDKKTNFLRYGITQAGIFSLAGLALKYAPEENLPGVNIDKEEPLVTNVCKGTAYAFVEQCTYAASQTVRNYVDFSKSEFGEGRIGWAKALANVCNERLVPGHFLSAISGSLSTYFLGDYIPKTSAALLGEFPMKIFNRVLNCHKRRATKHKFEYATYIENGKEVEVPVRYLKKGNEKEDNFRFNTSGLYKTFLEFCRNTLEPVREGFYHLISKFFKVPVEDLKYSFDISEKVLERNKKRIKEQVEKNEIEIISGSLD